MEQIGPDNAALPQRQIRDKFVDRMWLCVCSYCVVVIPIVIWRELTLGGGMARVAPVTALSVLAIAVTPVRNRLPQVVRLGMPPALLALGGLAGLYSYGLQGSGMIAVIFGSVCAITVAPLRVGVAALSLIWLAVIVIALCYMRGVLQAPFGVEFASSAVNWVGTTTTTVLLTVYLSAAIADYQRSTGLLLHKVERQRDQIAALANHDALTGLPSLRLARDRLEMACSHALRTHTRVAVLFIDLDGFKCANDSHGHLAGDLALRTVAQRLMDAVRTTDTAARIGGDEFLVILNGVEAEAVAIRTAQKIIAAIAEPILYQDRRLRIGASVGISFFPDHGQTSDMLLDHADQAMYRVKRTGKNDYAVFRDA
ncbi:GGDEF domain-containing protein [Duganella sp. LX20W]|uniref:GGDEF domain-containing protein n=1 Tax=Rugamonas brunnea TaxID=2758569 RepID=A0A7W2I9U0_9BURK|nr:GGDEF domain-containing protein [Rugamonas brunnea]MBA5635489.1 GGDEF domain-containing protein [Rugamonas brunnea]